MKLNYALWTWMQSQSHNILQQMLPSEVIFRLIYLHTIHHSFFFHHKSHPFLSLFFLPGIIPCLVMPNTSTLIVYPIARHDNYDDFTRESVLSEGEEIMFYVFCALYGVSGKNNQIT